MNFTTKWRLESAALTYYLNEINRQKLNHFFTYIQNSSKKRAQKYFPYFDCVLKVDVQITYLYVKVNFAIRIKSFGYKPVESAQQIFQCFQFSYIYSLQFILVGTIFNWFLSSLDCQCVMNDIRWNHGKKYFIML